MKNQPINLLKNKTVKWLLSVLGVIVVFVVLFNILYEPLFESYTGVKNAKLTYDNSKKLSDSEFEALAKEIIQAERKAVAIQKTKDEKDPFTRKVKIDMLMNTPSFLSNTKYKHIKFFEDAGIRQYKGPETCLKCHKTMTVHHPDGRVETVNTLDDVVNSIHFTFQRSTAGFTTYGFDGREVNAKGSHQIPVGKIDRACGIPGSFSWTGWAALVKARPAHLEGKDSVEIRSEGCGGCHIGGNYQPATEKMMPVGDVPEEAKEGIDCLICHSQTYDMNYRYVIKDKVGLRWNQDRTMRAAMTVTKPTDYNCLTCHQHDLGGDVYKYNEFNKALGYKHKRLLHTGTKRGTGFSPKDDVHSRAGLVCTDCHVPEGHKIPRGNKGVDLISNDLPGKKVACENCHTSAPHTKSVDRVILNGHVARLACETCHITHLQPENVVLRDWVHPTWNEEEGLWIPTDIYRSGETDKGFTFMWFNGNGTFLANALGDNPSNPGHYNPLDVQMGRITDPEIIAQVRKKAMELKKIYDDIDVDQYVEMAVNPLSQLSPEMMKKREEIIATRIRPIMEKGESKIYPFKLFNAMMYEDMGNQGPFGAMILPFDYPTYYETGDALQSVFVAVKNPIIKRMYETPFKEYMMDEFMYYFGVDGWNTTYPIQNGKLENVEAHWMRQMGSLMINHGITKDARQCVECHTTNGIMDFKALGYPPERVKDLTHLPELKTFHKTSGRLTRR
ncbi:MAG TPA: nitrite reductase [Caldithrix abyssi]|uniref:Nitrite reductase n=1 Tax=Caldithrix abyssi TaxID=187145 RepID=A0A7V5UEG5_CALAY|nr:nitrite reductase [Caldithrix abyssi]